ncbi:MAG: DRTGG domain-containing protein [Nitrospirota bacterium]
MKLFEIVEKLSLEVKSSGRNLQREVTGGYVSDLLSDVIANSKEGDIWITLQTHPNTIAVASLKNLSGVIIVNGRQPEEETLKKAEAEGITIMVSRLPTFEIAGRLYHLLK